MAGRTVPLVSADEPDAFAPGALDDAPIDIENGHSGYWHPGHELDIDTDFFQINVAVGIQNGIYVASDLMLISGVPGEPFGETGPRTAVIPEVTIADVIIYEEVILADGRTGFVEMDQTAEYAADEIRDDYWEPAVNQQLSSGVEVLFTPQGAREAYATYVWAIENGERTVIGGFENARYTGRYFVEVQTQEFPPLSAWAMANADVYTNGRYMVSEAFQYNETLPFSLQTDAWGAGWLETIAYGVGNGPPVQDRPPTISISNASDREGSLPGGTELVFEIRLSEAASKTVTVDYFAKNGTAIVGEDFQSADGTLTFTPGQTVKYVSVNVIRDFEVEPDEYFTLQLSNAVYATIADGSGGGTIRNDDDQLRSVLSPFPGSKGLDPTAPLTSQHGAFLTDPATYDPVSGYYSSGGTTFDGFDRGVQGIVAPTAESIVQSVYRFAVQSTVTPVRNYLNAWLNSAEAGQAVDSHMRDQFGNAFGIADAIVTDDTGFDVDAAFGRVEARFNQFQLQLGGLIGADLARQASSWLRFGVQHSAISTAVDIDARAVKATIIANAGHRDVWFGSAGADRILLGDLNDAAWGGWGDDSLYGESADDALAGSLGNDALGGGDGDDHLLGGEGHDTLEGGAGADILDGGIGMDTASYATAASQVSVNLQLTIAQDTRGGGLDRLVSIERLTGSRYGDVLIGDNFANLLTGGPGNDQLEGSAGNDTLRGENGHDLLTGSAGNDIVDGGEGIDLATYGAATGAVRVRLDTSAAQNTLGAGTDTLISIEQLSGSRFNDTLTGNAVANVISGLLGNDTISGGSGDDSLFGETNNDTMNGGAGNDRIDGGGGVDTASYAGASAAVTVSLGILAAQNTLGAGMDTLTAIEQLTGSGFDDRLTGNGLANLLAGALGNDVLSGASGNDILNGDGGSDTLDGGAGDDTLDGGAGNDTASYAGTGAAVTVNLGLTTAQDTRGAGRDVLAGVERLVGSVFGDTLTGDGLANILNGGAGSDAMNGGAGNDLMYGENGDDVLAGGLGNDTINGGLGLDTASFATATMGVNVHLSITGPQVTFDGADSLVSIERLLGSAFNDALNGNTVANLINGAAGNDVLVGWGGADTLEGGAGADILDGADGNDLLDGGLGDDTLNGGIGVDRVSYASATAGVYVRLANTGAQNTGGSGMDSLTSIEQISGSAFGDLLFGNVFGNVIDGGLDHDRLDGDGGNDSLYGGDGNDSLVGGAGDDRLDGGDGGDTASYATATAGVNVRLALSGAQNTGGGGTDTLIGIEYLTGSALADTLTGSSGNNTIAGGAGDDLLKGAAGGDLLQGQSGNDTINGGLNNDRLYGGEGNDRFVYDAALGDPGGNADMIYDFGVGDDTIVLDQTIFGGLATTGALTDAAFYAGTAAHDADDRVIFDINRGMFFYDPDGTGAAEQILFGGVTPHTLVTVADFLVIG